MRQLLTAEWEERSLAVPDWVEPVIAACRTLSRATSSTVASIMVTGALGDPRDVRLLVGLAENLAEEHDLEVTLDAEGSSFTARFTKVAR